MNSTHRLTGKIIEISQPQGDAYNRYPYRQEFTIEYASQMGPNAYAAFQIPQNRLQTFDYKVGDMIEVEYLPESKKSKTSDKWFTNNTVIDHMPA